MKNKELWTKMVNDNLNEIKKCVEKGVRFDDFCKDLMKLSQNSKNPVLYVISDLLDVINEDKYKNYADFIYNTEKYIKYSNNIDHDFLTDIYRDEEYKNIYIKELRNTADENNALDSYIDIKLDLLYKNEYLKELANLDPYQFKNQHDYNEVFLNELEDLLNEPSLNYYPIDIEICDNLKEDLKVIKSRILKHDNYYQ